MRDNILDYSKRLSDAIERVDESSLIAATSLILNTIINDGTIYVCGNGGSLSLSEHLMCDVAKGLHYDASFNPKVNAITSSSIVTAIANDIGYEDIFSFQLKMSAKSKDILIVISASGNSPNVVKALRTAHDIGMTSIGMCGFDKGKVGELADIVLYTGENNYGIIEDSHSALMHIIAQSLRKDFHNKKKELKL